MQLQKIFSILIISIFVISCAKDEEIVPSTDNQEMLSSEFGQFKAAISDTEPNNTISKANGPIGFGSSVSGQINGQGDVDYYALAVDNGVPMSIYLTGSTYYIGFVIYNKSGVIKAQGYYNQTLNYTPDATGNYYIKVHGYPNVTYSLSISDKQINESEPNNSFGAADGPISVGTKVSGIISGDNDYIRMTIPESGPRTFYLTGSSTYVTGILYNSSYQVIAQVDEREPVTFLELPAGTYYVKIYGYNNQTYTWHFDPLYDDVNSIYFSPQSIGYGHMVEKYISSTYKFVGGDVYDLEDFDNLFPNNLYCIDDGRWHGDMVCIVENRDYKGFPMIYKDFIVGW